jgi:hypothetical protein
MCATLYYEHKDNQNTQLRTSPWRRMQNEALKRWYPKTSLHGVTTQKTKGLRVLNIWGSSAKFVDWRQYAAVMQREAVTVIPSCSSAGNVVVA